MHPPGPKNLITDVDGIRVGNASDESVRTGVTVILPDKAAIAAVDVRGGAPGTRETDALDPTCLVDRIDAVTLSGGSAFGLDSSAGVMAWLKAEKRGFSVRGVQVPIVPCAILFDLSNGGIEDWDELSLYRDLGYAACSNLVDDFPLGNVGAGFGAKAENLKGGLGSASSLTSCGVQVGAIVAANPFGSVIIPGTDCFWAGPLEWAGEFGNRGSTVCKQTCDFVFPIDPVPGESTVIGVVATNVALDVVQAQRVAIMAQDGIARAVRPAHAPFDGDTIFAMATGEKPLQGASQLGMIGMMAADCVARAIARGIYNASSLGSNVSYRSLFG